MNTIKSLDLWTEQYRNQFELFNGCFIDGFDNEIIPFDSYKVVKNCNCVISSNSDILTIGNKHNAIVFYKGDKIVSRDCFFHTLKLKDNTKITFTLYAYGKEAEREIIEIIKKSVQ